MNQASSSAIASTVLLVVATTGSPSVR
jgi:hypothetical protein